MRSVTRKLWAYLRQDALTASSYRVRAVLSLVGLGIGAVPLFFVANALQPMMGPRIAGQGREYFSFVLVGIAAQQFVFAMADALPRGLHLGIRNGTLEAVFATPTPLPVILAGMASYRFVWALAQASVLILVGALLGASFSGPAGLLAPLLVLLIAASYIPFGLLAAALILSFRTAGPIPTLVGTGSVLLGGVYYPTDVIPSWIGHLSAVIPLTYGLRALRRVLLEVPGTGGILSDVAMLFGLLVVLLLAGGLAFHASVRYARRSGTLTQY